MTIGNLLIVYQFSKVEYEYSFIDHGYSEDPAVLRYFTTEAANAYKKALYCIVSSRIF